MVSIVFPDDIPALVYELSADGAVLRLWAKPGARRSEITGTKADEHGRHWLRVSVKEPPEDGKANAALIAFLADHLGVRQRAIRLMQGETSPKKLFFIEG